MTEHGTREDEESAQRETRTSPFVHALQGLAMGTADVIPGVSGGTLALIMGIYERLIDSIHETAAGGASLLRGDRAGAARHWRTTEWRLVLPLGVGIVVALGIGSVVLPPLIEGYPVITSAVFFGLIAGALPIPWRRIGNPSGVHYGLAVAGGVAAFLIAGVAPAAVAEPALPVVFGAAMIAICAMILPGVSGAYLLLIMGLYETTLHALSDLNLPYVGVFVLGAITGLSLFSKLLSWLLDNHQDMTMAVLVGLMAGSLRRLWPWQTEDGGIQAPPDGGEVALAIVCVVVGLALVTALTIAGNRAEQPS